MHFNNYSVVQGLRLVLWLASAITLAIGVAQISESPRSQIGAAMLGSWVVISMYLPYALAAVLTAMVAEVAVVLVRISENLDHLRESNRHLLLQAEATSAKGSTPAPPMHTKTPLDVSRQSLDTPPRATGHPLQLTLEGRIAGDSAPVFQRTTSQSDLLGNSKGGRPITLYGRDATGAWVCGDLAGTKWVRVSDLSISGDVMFLPVITPPPPAS